MSLTTNVKFAQPSELYITYNFRIGNIIMYSFIICKIKYLDNRMNIVPDFCQRYPNVDCTYFLNKKFNVYITINKGSNYSCMNFILIPLRY